MLRTGRMIKGYEITMASWNKEDFRLQNLLRCFLLAIRGNYHSEKFKAGKTVGSGREFLV